MPAVLFNLVINWVMQHTTEDDPRGIRWSLFTTLEDLDLANDLVVPHPLTHTGENVSTQKFCSESRTTGHLD